VIALLDYGSGNLRSVEKALRKVGADVNVTTDRGGMKHARGVVLPGVGAFDDCITAMQRQELLGGVKEFIASGRPFLGICVGYQALFEKSEEFNSCAAGLGIFGGRVVRFPTQPGLKVPQIGWNQIDVARPDCPLFQGIDDGSYVYFVHSFFPKPWRSSGETLRSCRSISVSLAIFVISSPNPRTFLPRRRPTISSRPTKAPPQMKRMRSVLT
jgi:glutamine amidotransferase